MKLELKHLAPYLPYGLNLKYEQDGDVRKLVYLDLQSPDRIRMNVKPLLYPLSYLTKEITVDGKTFVPMVELAKLSLDTDKPFQLHDRRLEAITRHSSINYPNAVYKTFSFTKDESFLEINYCTFCGKPEWDWERCEYCNKNIIKCDECGYSYDKKIDEYCPNCQINAETYENFECHSCLKELKDLENLIEQNLAIEKTTIKQ